MALDIKNIDLKNIDFRNVNVYEWPLFGRFIVQVLVCMGVFYFGYVFDFSSQGKQIYEHYKQEQDLKGQVKSILKHGEEMKGDVAQFSEVVKLLNQWQGQLVNSNAIPDLLNQIVKSGTVNQLKIALFTPGAKQKKDDYYMVPIKIVATGDYNKIANFISQISNMGQIVTVTDFVIAKENSSGNEGGGEVASTANRLTATLTLKVYYLADKSSWGVSKAAGGES